jgi:arylamine N-acetyltransferase
VQPHALAAPVGATGNHLALTVHGLPRGPWFVDVGLGDALHEPVPLRAGAFRQGPFGFALDRSAVTPGGWRLDHDPAGGFVGMDFDAAPAGPDAFDAMHAELSTSPTSGFVRVLTAQRRHADGADLLRGCVLTTVRASGTTTREVSTMDDWVGVLTGTFGIGLADVPPAERAALWDRIRAAHRDWVAATRR